MPRGGKETRLAIRCELLNWTTGEQRLSHHSICNHFETLIIKGIKKGEKREPNLKIKKTNYQSILHVLLVL